MNPRTTLLLVVVTAVLTGCIGPFDLSDGPEDTTDGNDTDTGDDRSGIVHDLQTSERQLFTGQSTLVELRLRNQEDDALTDIETVLGNTGRLGVQRQIPDTSSPRQERRCRYDQIPADSGQYRCVWEVTAPRTLDDLQSSITLPLTAYTTYTQSLPPGGTALDIAFEADRQIDPNRDTTSMTLQDAAVTARFTAETPVSAGQRTVPVTVSINNTGPGTISGDTVDIQLGGTLADAEWTPETTCVQSPDSRTMRLSPENGAAERSCTIVLAADELAGKTFFLRPHVTYRYMITDESPITVTTRR